MEFDNKDEYRIIFWKGNLEDTRMSLFARTVDGDYKYLEFHRYPLFA